MTVDRYKEVRSRHQEWCRILLSALLLTISGCATTQFVELREKPRNPLTARLNSDLKRLAHPSAPTCSRIIATGYQGPMQVRPMLKHIRSSFPESRDRGLLSAEAELNYLAAVAGQATDEALSSELFLDAAEAAWRYFSVVDSTGQVPDPTDEPHRAVAEVYNASVEALLRVAQRRSCYRLGQSMQLPLSKRRLQFDLPRPTVLVNSESLGAFRFVSDYELKNLRNRHIAHGLGVPIIAVRNQPQVPHPIEEFYTDGMSCSATVLLKFPDVSTSNAAGVAPLLQVYDPRESDGIYVNDQLIPLEIDFSTPLAQYLSNPSLSLLDTWGLVRPDRVRRVSGLYMVQPYDPNRIPVLMVHGLWSSPMTWMEMFNDLQADPDIRRRYQFWFYLYPSGEPLAVSAANLRDELTKVRDSCDPHRHNPNMDDMVVVGHSMGGLISQLLTIDSEDRLWNSVSDTPVSQLRASPEELNDIRRVYFFESSPSIDRIVTIASPYAGSSYSNRFTRWLGSAFIWLPRNTLNLHRILEDINGATWKESILTPRTSVDSLQKESAILTLVRSTSVPEDVRHHNIVGVSEGRDASDWSDGVVAWQSSHRPDATTEIVVKARHSDVHRDPEAIGEVRRVLLEHLNGLHQRRIPVVPVRSQLHREGHAATSRPAAHRPPARMPVTVP